jgi:Lrp/AsnC family transcriptional regulator for asnA, asnC and gidA
MSRSVDLDERIIEILQQDARSSNREIGRRLNVAEGTVRARLKRLLDAGAIRFGALVAPEAMGLNCTAYVRLMVAPRHTRTVATQLAEMPAAQYVGLAAGRYNVVSVLLAKDREDLRRIVETDIQPLPGVTIIDVRELTSTRHRYDLARIK